MRMTTILSAACLVSGVGLPTTPAGAEPARWSWEEPNATVKPTGDIEWKPKPFVFQSGSSIRYIDFAGGDDANDGESKKTPFKHHPWDKNATARAAACRGIHTYVFKRGVAYRGTLTVNEEGAPGNPIRLTNDPSWGKGEAVICGSETVRGWKKGADNPLIPEPGKVWRADLDFTPRCVWIMKRGGKITRIPLARTPNWKVSDPDDVKSGWWHWNYPTGTPFDVFTKAPGGGNLHLGIDTDHLTKPADYYQDAILWTEHGWVMGAPYPVRVRTVDTEKKGLGFEGRWGDAGSYKIVKYNRYFIEDKPEYLDDPDGEFWFDKGAKVADDFGNRRAALATGEGGRLYIRLPGGADPNSVVVEAARYPNMVDAKQMNHVHITGLTFRFTNVYWNLDGVPYRDGDAFDPACIRLMGTGTDIRVANCLFEHVNTAVYLKAGGKEEPIDRVLVEDNEVRFTDRGGFHILEGSAWGEVFENSGRLYDVRIMRNRLEQVGMRPTRFNLGFTIDVMNARTIEAAGNILDRVYGGGINISGAKRNSSAADRPFSRILIHHNKVTDPLLSNDDFGGIETWQGGPAYVYDNISGNPGGYRNFGLLEKTRPAWARFGHAYYLDGAFKNYHFNNIAWGKSKDPLSRLGNTAAFQEIHSYQNTFFNNTVYNFVKGTRRQAPQAGRDKFLGNIWEGIGEWLFWHSEPAGSPEEGNAADAGPKKEHFAFETNAYARNVFYDLSDNFGVFEPSGRWHTTFESFQKALTERKSLQSGLGSIARKAPLRDPGRKDFRPAPGSEATGQGVRVFVPWALHAVVAEWNFYPAGDDVTSIPDEHWYMTPYYIERDDYYTRPMYPLKAVNVGANDYVPGPLEDWIKGALALNGRNQYAVVGNDRLAEPFKYSLRYNKDDKPVKEERTAAGEDLKNPQVHRSNFLIEAYFRTNPGHTGGILVEKMQEAGYSLAVNRDGGVDFAARGPGGSASLPGRAKINDGSWHHVIAESDRQAGTLTVYIDGKKDAVGPGVGAGVSLVNGADLYVGGTPRGRCLAGSLDFLRIALGTLADASTTIEELYAWEFNGPFLRDFTGRIPGSKGRDAGAIQSAD